MRFQVLEQRPRAEREAVVFLLRCAGLFRRNTAWRQHEAPFVRHATRRVRTHRNETKGGEAAGLAGQNRGVVLAAAVSADAGIALQGAEAEAVLDAGVITRHVESASGCSRVHSSRRSSAPMRASTAATLTISALELLMPEARGRSLANTMSAPSAAAGKLRGSRRGHDRDVIAPAGKCRASSGGRRISALAAARIDHVTRLGARARERPQSHSGRRTRASGRRHSRCACRRPRAVPGTHQREPRRPAGRAR